MNLSYPNLIQFTSFYPYYFYPLLGITTILFILEQYVVFTQTPKQMRSIKWFIFNVSFTNFLLVLVHCLYQAVPVYYPVVSSMSKGLFGVFGLAGNYIAFWINTTLTLTIIQAYLAMMWYHYAIFRGRGRLVDFILDSKKFIATYGTFTVFNCIALLVMSLCHYLSEENVFQNIPKNDTNLIRFVEEMLADQPSASVNVAHANIWVGLITFLLSVEILIFLLMLFVFNFLLIKTIRATSHIVTKKTLALQKSFYKSALIESIFVLAFVLSPSCIPIIMITFNIVDLRVGVIGFNLVIISAPISCIMNMIMIRPYRRFFLRKIKKNFVPSTVSAITVQPINVLNK